MAQTKATTELELKIARRQTVGTRRIRRLRGEGAVPGVVYGRGMEPVPVVMDHKALVKVLHSKAGEHSLVKLKLAGAPSWEKPALLKSMQYHPVDGRVLHVDFHAITLTERLKVKVPVVLKGEPVGVKQEGGLLEHFLREVEVECLPTEIPASVEFDVSAMKIGDTIHVRDLAPPAHTKITSDLDSAIASVQKPKEEKPEEAAAAVTEPEVIREKKEEPQAPAEGAPKPKAEAEPKKEAKEGKNA
ncbi:MAG: 50S ribosomal protein L25 [Candidatus Omnitrophica bacterium]|nr:50S ribosomal protein L25 [Candidatus Omnitrophota bacterium]